MPDISLFVLFVLQFCLNVSPLRRVVNPVNGNHDSRLILLLS